MVMIFFCMNQNILPENDLIVKNSQENLFRGEKKKINFKKSFLPRIYFFNSSLENV